MIQKRHAFIFMCVIITCFQKVLCTFTFSQNEINMGLYGNASVDFLIGNSFDPEQDITVKFSVENEDIINIEPKFILIRKENFSRDSVPIKIHALEPGKSDISAEISPSHLNLHAGFTIVNVYKSHVIVVISNIIGWIYFVAWSISFYPQMWTNFRRKSVVGLSFDFVSLNIVGFTCYSIFNVGLYAIPSIKEQYSARYPQSVIPVLLNDVVFSLNGTIAIIFTGIQCLVYESRNQRISNIARGFHVVFAGLVIFSVIFAFDDLIEWLDFLYICSYIKLSVTITKYVPQAYLNYCRKSTVGWNIYNVLWDLLGGILSIVQMFLNAHNHDEWEGLIENPTKFWLGALSIVFDVIFIVQHYVLYKEDYSTRETEERLDEEKAIVEIVASKDSF